MARVWSTLKTHQIYSKPGAASWAIERLPEECRQVMQRAKAICIGEQSENWDDLNSLIPTCAQFMLSQIKRQIDLLKSTGYVNKTIRYAEIY